MESRFKQQGKSCVMLSRKYTEAIAKLHERSGASKTAIVQQALDEFFDNLMEPL